MAQIIAIANQKGGVAKTTSALNIGTIMANMGKKVLMIDLDPQSSLSISLGIEQEEINESMFNVVCENMGIDKIIVKVKENLYLAPSTIDLSAAELKLVNEMARENVLKKKIDKVAHEYDFILIDCPPSLGLLVVNALNAAHSVLIPCSSTYLAYRGLKLLLDTIEQIKDNLNNELEVLGVVVTLFNKRTIHSKEVLEVLETKHNVLGVVEMSVQAQDSVYQKVALADTNPNHPIVGQYKKVAEAIINVTK